MRGGWVAASSGALALLAGCSGNPGGAGADAHPGGEPASSSSASPTVTAELGPLALALGYEVWNPEARDYLAELTAEQDVIAACMREAGFEYWPHVPTIEGILVWDGL